MILILQKGMKSLQLRLNEFFTALDLPPVSTSAFSQMRQNLSYTAFVELNQEAVVKPLYEDTGEYQTWRGFRLLGIDGSKIILPDSASFRDTFGSFRVSN